MLLFCERHRFSPKMLMQLWGGLTLVVLGFRTEMSGGRKGYILESTSAWGLANALPESSAENSVCGVDSMHSWLRSTDSSLMGGGGAGMEQKVSQLSPRLIAGKLWTDFFRFTFSGHVFNLRSIAICLLR